MKLRAISLIRDEIDIIGLFLKHIDALFDEIILLDHQSMDGTTELLRQAVAQRPSWKYYRVDIKQKFQKQLMNFFIQRFGADEFDYLFFLDGDEFFWVKDRRSLEELLTNTHSESGVYAFKWFNSITKNLGSLKPLDKNNHLIVSNEPGGWQKIVVNWKRIDTGDFCVKEGNHEAYYLDGQVYPNTVIGKILHIPIRSRHQFTSKGLLTHCSLLLEANRTPGYSFQFNNFVQRIAKNSLSDAELMRCMYYYQIANDPIPPNWEKDFLSQCTVQKISKMGVAFSDRLKLKFPKHVPSIEQRIANALLNGNILDPNACRILLKDETISIDTIA
ncbi:MAG: glycosyltransferase family 2 protein [Anaerolineaceae bacterium]|nr:glycosyltransferase family 2 protein [Anaerolineaceae bacterium]